MANIFSNMMNGIGQAVGNWLSPYIGGMNPTYEMPKEDLAYRYSVLRNYYDGNHRPQLLTKQGAQNENITQNWIGNIEDKAIARMYRGGIQFNLPDGADAQQEYIDKVWDINKKEILLYQYRLHGGVYGTPYFKICPKEMIDPYTDEVYPRLTALDPETVRIHTSHDDMSEVYAYVISYSKGNKMCWEITHRSNMAYGFDSNNNVIIQGVYKEDEEQEYETTWIVAEIEQDGSGPRVVVETIPWPYNFPPIIHQKNLPSLKSCYGDSDFDDVINVQDKSNFTISNINKILKFQAYPTTVVTGTSAPKRINEQTGKEETIKVAPEGILFFPNAEVKAFNLEMESDLASSRNLAQDLKKSIFEVSREVSMDSIGDNLGQLTNFGLRVLYTDALDKTDMQRQLYGDALKELNRRLLVLNNMIGEASDPGKITWGDAIISNVTEDLTADEKALGMGIIDKETVTRRYISRYGVDYDVIQANLKKQQTEANSQNANIGADILRRFKNGEGVDMNPQKGINIANPDTTSKPQPPTNIGSGRS